jgi:hypothetical protein
MEPYLLMVKLALARRLPLREEQKDMLTEELSQER